MRYIFLIFILLQVVGEIYTQSDLLPTSNILKMNDIESIFVYDSNIESGDNVLIEQYIYNENGETLEAIRLSADGLILDKYIYKYNDMGLLLTYSKVNSENKVVTTRTSKYDKKGNLLRANQYDGKGKLLLCQKYKYNNENQKIEIHNKFGQTGKFKLGSKISYNQNGSEHRHLQFYPDRQETAIIEYEYDNNLNLIATYKILDSDKRLETERIYNSKNQLTELHINNNRNYVLNQKILKGGSKRSIFFEYDDDGLILKKRVLENDKLHRRIKYVYKRKNL